MVLLRSDYFRVLFVEERGIERLMPMLSSLNTQLVYDAVHCLWLISLQRSLLPRLESAGAPAAVARVTRLGQPTKVLRVALALLVSVLKNPSVSRDTFMAISETTTPVTVAALATAEPPVSDPELAEDVRWLSEALSRSGGTASDAISRYEAELRSGRLSWSAVHSPEFWKENIKAFEKDAFSLIKALAALIEVRRGSARAGERRMFEPTVLPPPLPPLSNLPAAEPRD